MRLQSLVQVSVVLGGIYSICLFCSSSPLTTSTTLPLAISAKGTSFPIVFRTTMSYRGEETGVPAPAELVDEAAILVDFKLPGPL
jgi:hypothetical protein